jgi:hypothetical protein
MEQSPPSTGIDEKERKRRSGISFTCPEFA